MSGQQNDTPKFHTEKNKHSIAQRMKDEIAAAGPAGVESGSGSLTRPQGSATHAQDNNAQDDEEDEYYDEEDDDDDDEQDNGDS